VGVSFAPQRNITPIQLRLGSSLAKA
jgi:hypothetical protein